MVFGRVHTLRLERLCFLMADHVLQIVRQPIKDTVLDIWFFNYLAISHRRPITYLFVFSWTSRSLSKELFELLVPRSMVPTVLAIQTHVLLRYPLINC